MSVPKGNNLSSGLADMRFTPQRRAVLNALRASHDHPRAADVLERVRRSIPGIGAATVYRSLAHLVASGQAVELNFVGGAARYDANVTRHDHLICDDCGAAVDIDVPLEQVARDAGSIASRHGFTVTAYDLRFHGLCAVCAGTPEPPRTPVPMTSP